ncbi:MAG: DUF4194 domain-containing protein [Labilithrix sp.]|nr:DUF4194 domain-containing protein [Labilithrix sp.]
MSEPTADPLALVLISLMKGVLEREASPATWSNLVELQPRARDYFAILGLDLLVNEADGLAYLRQKDQDDSTSPLPRLVPRRPLSYPVSLLLALLRGKLAELDATSGETRLVLARVDIIELVRLFLGDTGNEARLVDRLDAHIQKVVELGFLKPLRGKDDQYEVRRLLKAFVDAEWLTDFDARLAEYRRHALAGDEPEAP